MSRLHLILLLYLTVLAPRCLIFHATDSDLVVDDSLAVTIQTSNKRWALTVRARPLPQAMIAQIEKQQALLARATAGGALLLLHCH